MINVYYRNDTIVNTHTNNNIRRNYEEDSFQQKTFTQEINDCQFE